MSKIRKQTFPRRQFLKGAAATAGTALVGPAALANSIVRIATPFAVFAWDGARFVGASRIAADSEKIERVRVTVSGSGTGPLQALDALFFVSGRSKTKPAGFRAWMPGSMTSRFEMPVSERDGITFLLTSSSLGRPVKSTIQLSRTGSDLKLREGSYVIVASGQSLSNARFDESQEPMKLWTREELPAEFQYLVLKVERA